jgi:hypothetical protein
LILVFAAALIVNSNPEPLAPVASAGLPIAKTAGMAIYKEKAGNAGTASDRTTPPREVFDNRPLTSAEERFPLR